MESRSLKLAQRKRWERARGSEPRANGVNGTNKGSGWRLEPSIITRERNNQRSVRRLSLPPHSLCSGRPRALAECPGQTPSRGESVASI